MKYRLPAREQYYNDFVHRTLLCIAFDATRSDRQFLLVVVVFFFRFFASLFHNIIIFFVRMTASVYVSTLNSIDRQMSEK